MTKYRKLQEVTRKQIQNTWQTNTLETPVKSRGSRNYKEISKL